MKPDEDKIEPVTIDAEVNGEENENEITNTNSEIEAPEDNSDAETESIGKTFYAWAADLVGCLIFVVLFFVFVVRIIGVDGISMEPTLHDSDLVLLLSNVFYEAETDDVVVVYSESYGKPIVKRIIATEGETIDIDFETGGVLIDGQVLDEPYIYEQNRVLGDMDFPLTVPEGCVFVMGDNRNHSLDSRFSEIGVVDERSILGKVLFRIFPIDSVGKID